MAHTPTARNDELEAAVRRARRIAESAGELDLKQGPFISPWPKELRSAVARTLEDGTYALAVKAVAESEPDLA